MIILDKRKSLQSQAFVRFIILIVLVVYCYLLSNAESGENAREHVFSSCFAGDFAQKAYRVMQTNQDNFFTHFFVYRAARSFNFQNRAAEQIVVAGIGN